MEKLKDKGEQWDAPIEDDEEIFDKVFENLNKKTLPEPVKVGEVNVIGYDSTSKDAVVEYRGETGLLTRFQHEGFEKGEDRFSKSDVQKIHKVIEDNLDIKVKWKFDE